MRENIRSYIRQRYYEYFWKREHNSFTMGEHVKVYSHIECIKLWGHVTLGAYTLLAACPKGNIVLYNCTISPHVKLLAYGLKPNSKGVHMPYGDIIIHRHAWIGTGATILGGVRVETHAIVGAGSVVTKDVPAYTIVAGNPAKIIGTVKP